LTAKDRCEVSDIPAGEFAPELDGVLVVDGTDDIEGEVSDDGHVFGAMSGSQAGLVVAEGTPEAICAVPESYTGRFLAPYLPAFAKKPKKRA
jgi:excinuclease ABC subunit A